ncbi:MAG: hypothetical protein QOH88_667 [Verrucomicrobiota bacterium]|jgi:hypothetical protein
MKIKSIVSEQGNTLLVTIGVVAGLLVLLGTSVDYSRQISREAQRSRKSALAMEIADGHLEMLFSNWRNIYRNTWTASSSGSGGTDYSVLGTNYFFTTTWNPGPAPTPMASVSPSVTPPPIATPAPSIFPTETGYTLDQYRIQAVDPMVSLDADGLAQKETSFGSGTFTPLSPASAPPAAYGPNKWQYSYYYLASVDVTVPTSTGNVTAKVRRVFEKKFDNPWTFAFLFMDDLEFNPTTAFTVNGPVHTNGSLYIGTSNFTTTSTVSYSSEYVNGYSAADTFHTSTAAPPNFAKSDPALALSDMPPSQLSPYLPFGWNLKLANADGSANNDSYHELIEQAAGTPDPLSEIRLYNQACYRILIDSSNNITITKKDGSNVTGGTYNTITAAITTNQAIMDQREVSPSGGSAYVRLATLDVSQIRSAAEAGNLPGWNGVLYIADTSTHNTNITSKIGGTGTTVTTTERAIRLINGYRLPQVSANTNNIEGMTLVSANPIYIKGNYNTSTGSADSVASNTAVYPSTAGTYTTPTGSGYTRKLAAVIGDSINVLSPAWSDFNSTLSISNRTASNVTINAALVGGIVPSSGGNYSGGGENFIRLLEDWKQNTFCYYGSIVELFVSKQGTGPWTGAGNNYKAPWIAKYYWDPRFADNTLTTWQSGPPGNMQIAAYLQQQRWYQVY